MTAVRRPVVRQFQFHKGTIKTDEDSNIRSRETLFQFHKGTIKTSFLNIAGDLYLISIP